MNRGVDRNLIFHSDQDRRLFLTEQERACRAHLVELHGYCLMSNHYHLLLRSLDGRVSRAMHQLGTRYGQQFNSRHGRDGPVFRARYFSKLIADEAQLVTTLRYIHRNPAEAGLVREPWDWTWSSASVYAGKSFASWGLQSCIILAMTAEVGQFAHEAVPGTVAVPGT